MNKIKVDGAGTTISSGLWTKLLRLFLSVYDETGEGAIVTNWKVEDKPAAKLDNLKVDLLSAPKVLRHLTWKGKKYEVGHCPGCNKEVPLLPQASCGWSEIKVSKSIVSQYLLVARGWCSKCTYRVIGDLEKAASDLRAACAGGTYSEPELKR